MTIEAWKDIEGYEGMYQVSDLGQVRTLGRVESIRNRWGSITIRNKPAKVMKQGGANNPKRNYTNVGLHKNGITTTKEVHKLVAAAFIGPTPCGLCTCHNNGNSKDNRAENLRYDTQSGNIADKKIHGTYIDGDQVSWATLSNKEVVEIRERYAMGESANNLSVEFNTQALNINRICRGERFSSAGGVLTVRRPKSESRVH